MNRILVEVTHEDIANGVRCCQDSCPVAHAIARTLGNYRSVYVGLEVMSWARTSGDIANQQETPVRVQRFIRRFDTHKPVEPFKFFIYLDEEE